MSIAINMDETSGAVAGTHLRLLKMTRVTLTGSVSSTIASPTTTNQSKVILRKRSRRRMVSSSIFENTKLITIGSVATVSGLLFGALLYRKHLHNKPPTNWVKVGEVEQLCIYPVKSFKAVQADKFECTTLGPRLGNMRDRSFAIINDEGKVVTGRDYPEITQLTSTISESVISLSSPSSPDKIDLDFKDISGETKEFKIWGTTTTGIDCGDEVATWISKRVLGTETGLRLVYCRPDEKGKELNRGLTGILKLRDVPSEENDGGSFSDAVSYHLISEASISELNSRLDGEKISPLNFRPNIVINGESLIPFEEDHWDWIKIGDVVFRSIGPCTRCTFTTVNPDTGKKSESTEPLASLKRYRVMRDSRKRNLLPGPVMGVYMGARSQGVISVGSEVFIPKT